jgi:NADH:ubiquinone oxidoreductase subunit 4 (subunit M)
MIAATASWAIYGAVKQWVNTEDRLSAEEFVSVAVELVRPIVMVGIVPNTQVDVPQSDVPATTSLQHS